ncbi:carboxypeptidase-like regulatory domain-containing protein [Zhouia spongiae]|uniref:Carboxypeptidase-like regulatory domain-containing protein n=1 Tax=Zhouia spongiae TaxID=2202721 RepID=A0ABY3YHF8_9FLAO|nr:carboxypeptidase-like regulatory domain-containing protein [Zhouia spongiae]UNY97349.1 carboxypeptidase-like regulatory domain-containing protein [Zhouia spongiae]
MKASYTSILILFLLANTVVTAQEQVLLKGTVLHNNIGTPEINVVNTRTEKATATNSEGGFQIEVKENDILAFISLSYEIQSITISKEILNNKRLVVELKEKVTELDEVVLSQKENEATLKLRNEEFKKVFYDVDEATPVENEALPQHLKGLKYGTDFVKIFKAIFKSKKEKEPDFSKRLKPSELLRQVYNDRFFVIDLKIPQDKIDDFLYYCDYKLPSDTLLTKNNEFQLIDFLVTQSKSYLQEQNIDPQN